MDNKVTKTHSSETENPLDTPGQKSNSRNLRELAERAEENTRLNAQEFSQRKIILTSTPQVIFVQINAGCNADCVFCSKGYDYRLFRLDDWLAKYGKEITPVLARARQVVLTGSGELLGLPDAPRIVAYFNDEFPHVQKYLATNGSYLTPKVVDLICGGESRYVLQLSLHGSNRTVHESVTRFHAYDKVQANIRHLMKARQRDKVEVAFMFVMTSLNIDDLPSFIRYAAEMGADRIMCSYFYIYEASQKYLSLYFMQERANLKIDEANRVAQELGVAFHLPPKFGQPPEIYRKPDCCPEPWTQLMMNVDGYVLPCDAYGAFPREDNLNERSFMDIWNGSAYRDIRKALAGAEGCLLNCSRHNPQSVNDWFSHVIRRPKSDAEYAKEDREALKEP